MSASTQQQTFVVVGGTTGIGFSGAGALVSRGANVVVVGRNPENVDKAVASLGGACRGLCGDATDSSVSERAVELAVTAFGRFDGLYHVAGGSGRSRGDGPLHEMTDEGLEFTMQLNLSSLIYSNRAAVRQFLKQGGGGAILNLGSVLGFSPSPKFFSTHAYAATKAAIVGFSKSVASRYAEKNIRVNVLAPALVETPMARRAADDETIQAFIATKQPLDGGRIGVPEDLDAATVFLLTDDSRFVTGQVLSVDGGWCVSEGQIPVEEGA
jgi:NAD(P)-dependent dehydrogenase (short-subunit alcohol dehydrogenase family)